MPLTAREAFKVGFLEHCAATGLDQEAIQECIKTAAEKVAFLGTLLGKGIDAGKGAAGAAWGVALPALLAGPVIAGGLGGYGLARATDLDDTDVKGIKDQELVDEYHRQTSHLERQRAVRDYLKARKKTGRMFL